MTHEEVRDAYYTYSEHLVQVRADGQHHLQTSITINQLINGGINMTTKKL